VPREERRRRKMKRALGWISVVALIGAGAAPAAAYTFLDRAYGTPELGNSARSRGMGGAGAALGNGSFSLLDNPGALALSRGTSLQLTGYVARASENRFVPLFDTFDSYVDESAIAVNNTGYGGIQGGFVLDEWGEKGLIVSGGVFTRLDPRYDYYDERRSTDTLVDPEQRDKIVNNRVIRTEGRLYSASLGVALPVNEELGVGAAVHYYWGTFDDRDGLIVTPDGEVLTSDTTRVVQAERKFEGFSLGLGFAGRISERLDVGASVETSPTLDVDYTTWENGVLTTPDSAGTDLDLPVRIQAGIAYRPRNTFRTTFAADLVYMPWTATQDELRPEPVNDTWEARFGLEHVFYNNLPARLGFRYGESYAMDEADRSVFTFGVGYVLTHMKIDLGGEVEKRNTRQAPIRPRADQGPYVGLKNDRVEDTLVRLFLGLEYGF
jgi:hypothetical protein